MNNKETIYCPLFTGFYNTIHELEDDYIIEDYQEEIENNKQSYYFEKLDAKDKKLDFDKLDNGEWSDLFDKYFYIDYKEYKSDYSKEYIRQFRNELSDGLKKIGITNIKYISLYSPKCYNYGNDEINIEVEYNIELLKKFLISEKDAFSKYIKENNTSYDGFHAYGTILFENYINKKDFEAFELIQIIDFYIKGLGDAGSIGEYENDLYYNTSDKIETSKYIKEI